MTNSHFTSHVTRLAALAIATLASPAAADIITGTDAGPPAHVKAFDATLAETASFPPYGSFPGGVRVAVGDVNDDGRADVITGAGPAGNGHVKVFSGANGAELRSFLAYGGGFTGGIFVSGGDVDNDGVDDVVTGTDSGFAPHVKAFSGATGADLRSFFAYGDTFTGGVRVAAGDVNNDGFADLVTGAGPAGNGHVKVFSGKTNDELHSFFAYGGGFTGGIFVGSGDVNNDGRADIVTGVDSGFLPQVKVFSGLDGSELHSFFAYETRFTGGVRVAAADVDGDSFDDIITGAGANGAGHVKVFSGATGAEIRSFFAYGASYPGGVFVAGSNLIPEPSCAALGLFAGIGFITQRRSRAR